MPSYAFIILAGGNSSRFGKKKELVKIKKNDNAISMIIDVIKESTFVTHIHVVYHPDYLQEIKSLVQSTNRPTSLSIAGQTRQESVYLALRSLAQISCPDYVLIHDAARPWISLDLIEKICIELPQKLAIIPALPVTDSIKLVKEYRIEKSVPREPLVFAQTPQGFEFKKIFSSHTQLHSHNQTCTDDAEVWELTQKSSVYIIPGELKNKKITYKEDIL
ncbi:MAG: IspD/TarI family cytidylyltransferase [Spirochaetia bacterium]